MRQGGERDGDAIGQVALAGLEAGLEDVGVGQAAGGEIGSNERGEFGLAGLVMGEAEVADDVPAGLPAGQRLAEGGPGIGVFAAGEDAVAVDRGGEGLRLAAQGMDDVAVVNAVGPEAVVVGAQAGMADDVAAAEEGLDAVIVEMDAQALAGR